MTGSNEEFPSGRLFKMQRESAQRSSMLHGQLLQMRQSSLRSMQSLIEMQIRSMSGVPAVPQFKTSYVQRPAIFDSRQLEEFGTGLISNCLGPYFNKFNNQRVPRIPNGDLKLMSRVVAIDGQRRDLTYPASITVEYDVPFDAWYLRDNAYPYLPWSVLMEIALQPCGFLSAYVDTYVSVPNVPFFYRNLDGSFRWLGQPGQPVDLRGQTITTQARVLSTTTLGGDGDPEVRL